MSRPGSSPAPHQGQVVSWCGEPSAGRGALGAPLLLQPVSGVARPVGGNPSANPKTDTERFVVPRLRVRPSDHFCGTDERGCALELLDGQQAQGIAHEDSDAVFAAAPPEVGLQAADRKRIGGQSEVGLSLAATGGEPEQVGDGGRSRRALRVRGSVRDGRLSSRKASWNGRQLRFLRMSTAATAASSVRSLSFCRASAAMMWTRCRCMARLTNLNACRARSSALIRF